MERISKGRAKANAQAANRYEKAFSGNRKKVLERRKALRAKITAGGKFDILRDTGTLFQALDVGNAGNLFEVHAKGIRVGFGGTAKHPNGKATIADIARFHDGGSGRIPKRQIINMPDEATRKQMAADLKKAIAKMMKGSGG